VLTRWGDILFVEALRATLEELAEDTIKPLTGLKERALARAEPRSWSKGAWDVHPRYIGACTSQPIG
jgi:hypothetical protein